MDDIVISYSIKFVDGREKILGYAGAKYVRSGSPISGIMIFDSTDFDVMSMSELLIQLSAICSDHIFLFDDLCSRISHILI